MAQSRRAILNLSTALFGSRVYRGEIKRDLHGVLKGSICFSYLFYGEVQNFGHFLVSVVDEQRHCLMKITGS